MKDIAREAGVAQGLLHYYFDGKERLIEAVVSRLLDDHLARFREVIGQAAAHERRSVGLALLRRKTLGEKTTWRILFEVLARGARGGQHRLLAARFAERRSLVAAHIGGDAAAPQALLLDALMLGLAAERLAGASDREVEDAFDAFVALIS